ncbi:Vegetative incompatibility protein HET-E-1 [Lachnellula suecica]|uniref:Vegetative incompatibility protein HET-E-1 n=1 Tax=Lachnellula suecica TaxID=602035 RepID=A0A8T9C462_9HELO|nr:Vegetative incompatibility protein HET-E-1 [Lachnellula suecica]
MRLLNVDENGEFSTLTDDKGEDDEGVGFKDLTVGPRTDKPGYRKLKFCAEQAARDELRFVWVDTCCIDKSNSTELSEAINSMFRWYQRAVKCYVYLPDVHADDGDSNNSIQLWEPQFRKSRWFTRGWTLQELLAPASVEFFSSTGIRLGDKRSLEQQIHEITGISVQALRETALSKFAVSERLSWAENRQTKREEDKAYSLLGIFDIHIPLIYGEGTKSAFERLQEQIDRNSRSVQDTILLNSLPYAIDAPFNSYRRQHESLCLADTRVNLLNQIYSWADRGDDRLIFWLNGLAGTGKSTIASTVARNFFDKKRLGASYFFSRGGGDVSHAHKFVASIAVQLARSIPDLHQHVCDSIRENSDITSRSLHDQWRELVLHPLSELKPATSQSYTIIVDALDECANETDIRVLLHLLAEVRVLTNIRLRIFMTSRPELPVRHGFAQIPLGGHRDFVLHNIAPSIIDHDIYLFLKSNLEEIREERHLDASWPDETIIRHMVKIASGLFIWAATACRFIREGKRFASKRLDMIIRESRGALTAPEKHLDQIYFTVLRQSVSSDFTDDEKEELYSLLKQVLGSIITLLSPLCISSLSTLIRVSKEYASQTLDELHSILDIPQDQDKPLRLHHPSFRDFLLNKERCTDINFQVNERNTHRTLVDQCIQIMSKALKQNICGLDGFGTSAKDVNDSRVQLSLPREVQYACLYWIQHLEKSEAKLDDGGQVYKFLLEHLLHWLEALILMGKISGAIYAIDALRSITIAGNCPSLSAFVHDTRRFVLYSRPAIENNPLQLYCSALLFAPQKSLVRQQLRCQVPNWVGRLPNVREDWNALHQTIEGDNAFCDARSHSLLIANFWHGGLIRIWNATTGVDRSSYKLHGDYINAIAFFPDDKMMALATYFGTVRLWDAATGLELYNLKGHQESVEVIVFSSDAKLIASGSRDMTVKLWNMTTGTELHTLRGHEARITTIIFLPDDERLASASEDKSEVKLWDVTAGTESQTLGPFDEYGDPLALSSGGKLLVTRALISTIRVWDTETGDELQRFEHHDKIEKIAISPDGRLLVLGSFETVSMWDIANGTEKQSFEGHKGWLSNIIFSSDGKMLATTSNDKTIKLWDTTVNTKRKISDEDHKSWVNVLAFSPDRKMLASGSHDNTVKLWDAMSGMGGKIISSHEAWINDVAFSPDSKLLATAGDKSVKLWDVVSGEELLQLAGHEEWVNGITFSPDGKFLASISIEKTIKLWDVLTGAEIRSVQGGVFRLESPLSHSLSTGDSTHVTFVNESDVNVMFFWLDMNGFSKHYWTIEPHQELTQQTFVGHFWRFINSDTNRTIGGYYGIPEHVDVVITDEDVMAVEENRQYLQNAIQRLHFWPSSAGVAPEESRPAFAIEGNWITDDSGKRLIWLPDEYRPTCFAINQNILVLGHASGQLTFLDIKTDPTIIPAKLHNPLLRTEILWSLPWTSDLHQAIPRIGGRMAWRPAKSETLLQTAAQIVQEVD